MPNTLGRHDESGGFAVTQTKTWGDRGLLVAAAILLLVWAVAGAVNAIGFIMGNRPTPVGILATLVVVCA